MNRDYHMRSLFYILENERGSAIEGGVLKIYDNNTNNNDDNDNGPHHHRHHHHQQQQQQEEQEQEEEKEEEEEQQQQQFAQWLGREACLSCMMNRNHHMRSVLKIYYDGQEAPEEGGMLKIYYEPESPHEKACLRCMMKLFRQMRGHA